MVGMENEIVTVLIDLGLGYHPVVDNSDGEEDLETKFVCLWDLE